MLVDRKQWCRGLADENPVEAVAVHSLQASSPSFHELRVEPPLLPALEGLERGQL